MFGVCGHLGVRPYVTPRAATITVRGAATKPPLPRPKPAGPEPCPHDFPEAPAWAHLMCEKPSFRNAHDVRPLPVVHLLRLALLLKTAVEFGGSAELHGALQTPASRRPLPSQHDCPMAVPLAK